MATRSTPVNVPVGIAASKDELSRAEGKAMDSQRLAIWSAGRRQHRSSGQVDLNRFLVSRPRNQRASSNVVPTLTEKAPEVVIWMLEVHQ